MKIIKLNIIRISSLKKSWKSLFVILGIYSIWWLAVVLCLISLLGLETTIKQFGSVSKLYGSIIHVVIKGTITFYILIFELALPLIRDRKRREIIIRYVVFLLFLTVYDYIWDYKIGTPPPAVKANLSFYFFLIFNLSLDVVMAVIAIFIAVWIESAEVIKREEELEKQKLNAELSAIKYQINPHFLFNSLSFIYTKTVRQNPEAAHAVHLLSEIMSYALDEWEDLGRVPLSLEVSHMKKVIEMNQIRFSNRLNVEYSEDLGNGDMTLSNAYVPTLAFITLVENAFKHGELNDEKNKVIIKLKVGGDKVCFSVGNKKKTSPKEPSKGIGLSNVQKRLQLMYGAAQTFIIKEDENYYLTEININLVKS